MGTDRWELVLRALNPTPFGVRDPLFDQDAAFYVFRLPLWNSLYGWLMGVLVLSGLAAIAVHFCTRGIQVSPGAVSIARRARGHLLALAALLLLLKAAGYRLAMFDLLFSQRGVAFGAGYADVHAQLPVLRALMSSRASSQSCAWSRSVFGAGAPSWEASPRWWARRSWAGSRTRV